MAAPSAELTPSGPPGPPVRKPPLATSSEVVAVGGLLALGVGCLLNPATIADGPVLCPFRRLTGLPCPGCGMTRSWVYLTHGWWRQSLEANPFGVVLAALVVALAVVVTVRRVRRTASPDLDQLVRSRWLRPVIVAWLAFAVVRAGVDLTT